MCARKHIKSIYLLECDGYTDYRYIFRFQIRAKVWFYRKKCPYFEYFYPQFWISQDIGFPLETLEHQNILR